VGLTDAHRRRLAVLPCGRRDLPERPVPRRQRHTGQNPIAEDFNEKERKLPPRLVRALEACRARLKDCKDKSVGEREGKRLGRLAERVRKCPPDGNVFEVTAKHGWRRRGWMDFAYPGIGRGAIVPSDWCGLGLLQNLHVCTKKLRSY
jgi:hypothetical protein